MSDLWFYETRRLGGGWAPCTAPERPQTKAVNGHVRIKRGEGMGPRVRRIQLVPERLHGLMLDELARALNGKGE